MAGVFRFPHQRDELAPDTPNLEYWMDRDRALEDWVSDPSFDLLVTVASDGTGDYTSIKDAIEGVDVAISSADPGLVTIFVKPSFTADYSDSGRGRVALRSNLRVNVVSGIQPAGWTLSAGDEEVGQQKWIFDGFTDAGSGSTYIAFSGFAMTGPNSSTWMSGSGSTTWMWFENCSFSATSSTFCSSTGTIGDHRYSFDNCTSNGMVLVATGSVTPQLYMNNCTMGVGNSGQSGIIAAGVVWRIENSSIDLPDLSGTGGNVWVDRCLVGSAALFSGPFYRFTSCSITSLSGTFDSNLGRDCQFIISGCNIATLSFSSGGSVTNNDDRYGVISGCIVGSATLACDENSLDTHGFYVDMVYTGTAITISGDEHYINCMFVADDPITVTLSGNNNSLFYRGKGTVTVNNTGSGNVVNSMAPSGSAGGDLGGSYPNPTVTNLTSLSLFDAKGDLLVATADNTVARLPVGNNGEILRADSTATEGVDWEPQYDIIDAKGDLIVGSAADTAVRVQVGTDGQILVADSGQTAGVAWQDIDTGSHTNLLTNNQASIEASTDGWEVYADCSISLSTAQASHGKSSLALTKT